MGIKSALRRWLTMSADETPPRPLADVLLDMAGRGVLPRAGRNEALSVPAVQRARNLICGSPATLPLIQRDAARNIVRLPLLEQIDPDVPNVVTIAQTLEDLLFDAVSWWEILDFGADGYPVSARHLDLSSVSVQPPAGRYPAPLPGGYDPREADIYVNGRYIPNPEEVLIRFDSPNPGLLHAGGRIIRRAVLLDTTSALYADNPKPLDYFTPTEGADPATDKEIKALLEEWRAARRKGSTAYVPAALTYNAVDTPTPADLQLVAMQREAKLDLANATGLDPEDLGVSTTSRTYQNGVDRRQDRVNDTYSPYMAAITDRLSMGDITKRGRRVKFDLDDYLRADPKTRAEVYALATAGKPWMAVDEVRGEEYLPDLTAAQRIELAPPAPAPADPAAGNVRPISSARSARMAAEDSDAVTFAVDVQPLARVDNERRIIQGLAVPYGPNAIAWKGGRRWRFQQGSLYYKDARRNKMLRDHDNAQPQGRLLSNVDTPDGMLVEYKIFDGEDGDRTLAEAQSGKRDGLSVGVEIEEYVPDPLNQGVLLVVRAAWRETSILAVPAYDDARVTRVAAGADKGDHMTKCATCGADLTEGVAHTCNPTPPAADPAPDSAPAAPALAFTDDQLRALLRNPQARAALVGVPAAPAGQQAPAQFAMGDAQMDALMRAVGGPQELFKLFAAPPAEQRQTVNPRRPVATTQVTEQPAYRFDAKGNLGRGKFDFSTDLIAGFSHGDAEALDRATNFMREQFRAMEEGPANFATAMTDVQPLNPNRQRPDLYVDQKEFQYPIWTAIEKGTIPDATPFTLPKFNTSSGLVGAHTENTEPTPGVFTATSQTITPSAVSGKVEISREAWDQGGNPQLSGLIWRQMIRAWFEALEASAVTLLEGSAATSITITTAAADAALEASITSQLAPLQYVRGGFSMRDFFVQVDLYKALIAAKDSNGRKLFPYLGAQNATGTMQAFFAAVEVAGLVGKPAWALAATSANSANSFLIDRDNVSGWATSPQRLTMENISVAKIHMGIWGYKALAITDLTGVRKLAYDPQ